MELLSGDHIEVTMKTNINGVAFLPDRVLADLLLNITAIGRDTINKVLRETAKQHPDFKKTLLAMKAGKGKILKKVRT